MVSAGGHRLARELADWGALERLPDGRYQIGMRLWHTGVLAPGHRDLHSLALPSMEDLYEATHEVMLPISSSDGVEPLVGRAWSENPDHECHGGE